MHFLLMQTKHRLYLVLDFVNGGHLFFQLHKQGLFREDLARIYTAEIVSAVSHLHSNGMMNRDDGHYLLEEMKRFEAKPTGQTYIYLLNACATAGRVDRVYAIVRDMIAAGLGLNKFFYAGLIAAHKNKEPVTDDVASKIKHLKSEDLYLMKVLEQVEVQEVYVLLGMV